MFNLFKFETKIFDIVYALNFQNCCLFGVFCFFFNIFHKHSLIYYESFLFKKRVHIKQYRSCWICVVNTCMFHVVYCVYPNKNYMLQTLAGIPFPPKTPKPCFQLEHKVWLCVGWQNNISFSIDKWAIEYIFDSIW